MDKYFLETPFETLWPAKSYPYDMDTHPTVQCAKALSAYNRGDMDEFLKGADWLVENQDKNGAWPALFDWKGGGYDAKAPWISCMTQGMGLSVLARVDSNEVGRTLQRALHLFDWGATSPHGVRWIEGCSDHRCGHPYHMWLEGTPSPKHRQILNESLFGLIGLCEAQDVAGKNIWIPPSLNTIEHHLSDFDLDFPFFKWSRYDNGYHCYSQTKYHKVHIQQLYWLAEHTGSRICREYATKWERWEEQYGDSTGRYVFYRLWKYYNKVRRIR